MPAINASLKARQAVQKAAKDVCEGKAGAKAKLAKAKTAALKVAKASIEKAAKSACSISGTKKAKAKAKAKPKSKARKPATRKRK